MVTGQMGTIVNDVDWDGALVMKLDKMVDGDLLVVCPPEGSAGSILSSSENFMVRIVKRAEIKLFF